MGKTRGGIKRRGNPVSIASAALFNALELAIVNFN